MAALSCRNSREWRGLGAVDVPREQVIRVQSKSKPGEFNEVTVLDGVARWNCAGFQYRAVLLACPARGGRCFRRPSSVKVAEAREDRKPAVRAAEHAEGLARS
jgi:hypothetical protein